MYCSDRGVGECNRYRISVRVRGGLTFRTVSVGGCLLFIPPLFTSDFRFLETVLGSLKAIELAF